jgi:heme-degrading monooxygenase HmoA
MFLAIFRNRKRAGIDQTAYDAEAAHMAELAATQPGYLSFKSYVSEDGEAVAISEWADEAAARAWGRHAEHLVAQANGRSDYYQSYTLYACAEPRIYSFERTDP